MLRLLPALFLFAASGCTDDAAPDVSVAVAQDAPAGDRRALSAAQLAAYVPAEFDGLRASFSDPRHVKEYRDEWTGVNVTYTDPDDPSRTLGVSVRDLIDKPTMLAESRRTATEPSYAFQQGTGPDREDHRVLDDGTLVEETEYVSSSGRAQATLFLVVGDRFEVSLAPSGTRGQPSIADLWAFYEASGLARLADAPVYADAAPAEMPAWASGEAEPPSAPAPSAPVAALPACDDVLPLAEVERVCGVSGIRLTPTAFVEEGPTACNRKYGVPRNLSGLYFIVSRYADAARARAGQRLSGDIEHPVGLRDVPGLGDAASRHVQNSEAGRTSDRVLSVAAGTDLIEMKSVVMPDEPDAEVCTLDQLETLARGVVARLTP